MVKLKLVHVKVIALVDVMEAVMGHVKTHVGDTSVQVVVVLIVPKLVRKPQPRHRQLHQVQHHHVHRVAPHAMAKP
jgi:hypothetical protein